jgi:hypothetical protein
VEIAWAAHLWNQGPAEARTRVATDNPTGHLGPTCQRSHSREAHLLIGSDHFFVLVSILTTFAPDLSEFCGQN